MAHQLLQAVLYNDDGPPPIESYPIRLSRILSSTDLQPYRRYSIDATREILLLDLLVHQLFKIVNCTALEI
jgi:hypothetical protein